MQEELPKKWRKEVSSRQWQKQAVKKQKAKSNLQPIQNGKPLNIKT
jgi:hypothetical protein